MGWVTVLWGLCFGASLFVFCLASCERISQIPYGALVDIFIWFYQYIYHIINVQQRCGVLKDFTDR